MEIIKRNKTAQRAAFTKVYTKLESVLIKENANVEESELCLHLLKQKTDSLELTHNEYLDTLSDETEFKTEFNIVEEYRENALIMEFKSKRVLEKIKSKQNNNESSNFGDNSHLAVCENPCKNTSRRLPELELYKFGELEIFVESATNVMKEGMLDRRGCESFALAASSESTRSPVLGLIWDKNLNALEIDTENLEFDEREKITKRKILSPVSRFDPTGFLAPVMIQPKILLQAT
ncbi:hypothetical protein CDAR_46871 [Caerostris darwini]|uniref:Uncharacterized protein n=1 Tax=Caerostris darwini TaxID=1538125 RepID=A0AAV4SZV6_9ARAC|nr:hypothetical protein CDAR_46871 [Caerostris darwini]